MPSIIARRKLLRTLWSRIRIGRPARPKRAVIGAVALALLALGGYGWVAHGWRLTTFAQSVAGGDVATTRKWLASDPGFVNRPVRYQERFTTPLHVAVANNDAVMVAALLDAGADPNGRDMVERTPLHEAADAAHGRTLRVFARSQPEVVAVVVKTGTVSEQIAATLIARGADVHARDSRRLTPLHLAAAHVHIPLIDLLLAHGAECDATNTEGNTPLCLMQYEGGTAAYKPEAPQAAARLLAHGANVNAANVDGDTPLHLALGRFPPPEPMVATLLRAGADTRLRNKVGKRPAECISFYLTDTALRMVEAADRNRTDPAPTVGPGGGTGALVADDFTVGPDPAQAGHPVTVRFRFRNTGSGPTGPLDVYFYIGRHLPVKATDRVLGKYHVPGLRAGEVTPTLTCELPLPPRGDRFWAGSRSYYVGVTSAVPGTDVSVTGGSSEPHDRLAGLWESYDGLYVRTFRPTPGPGYVEDRTVVVNNPTSWKPGSPTTTSGPFGRDGDTILVGDFDGDGRDELVAFRKGTWLIDSNNNGIIDPTDRTLGPFGEAGDVPVVGDWTGDGRAKVGVFRRGLWVLDAAGTADPKTATGGMFGEAGDVPVVGDWTGDGRAKVGVFRRGLWVLDAAGKADPTAAKVLGPFGYETDVPVVGDWGGTGIDRIGVVRDGTWILDVNGSGSADTGDRNEQPFGSGRYHPLVGRWEPRTKR